MQNIVGVQFAKTGKVYYFDPKGISFAVGDGVIVETAQGVEYGKITIANTDMEESKIVGTLKPVMRKATPKDTSTHLANIAKGKTAIAEGKARIAKHGLDMKLVDVEYAFDGNKIIFYFTSENRVDFRELVKDLAGHFKNRIELKQIGIRDECKQKGGLGPCGRPCCCNNYMVDFERVSIKMAKNQGLSLNPTKISGLCGRLMCCLNFEDEYYKETLKFMPKFGSNIVSSEGKGYVDHVDMLRQNVRVKMTLNSGETETRVYNIKQLTGSGSEYTVVHENVKTEEADMPQAVMIADQVVCDSNCDSCDKCNSCTKCDSCDSKEQCTTTGKKKKNKKPAHSQTTQQSQPDTNDKPSNNDRPNNRDKNNRDRNNRRNKNKNGNGNNGGNNQAKGNSQPNTMVEGEAPTSVVATATDKPKSNNNKRRRNRNKKKPNGNGGANNSTNSPAGSNTSSSSSNSTPTTAE